MRIPRFYLPLPLSVGATVPLDDNSFNHAVRVLRLKPDATLVLFNGEGSAFKATITQISKRQAWVQITDSLSTKAESPLHVTLAQSISRSEKMDFTLQKAVELGAHTLQPLFTERSNIRLSGDRLARKIQHWHGIVIGACEQCGRNRLPILKNPVPLTDWLQQLAQPGLHLLLEPQAEQGLGSLALPSEPITLLIGSEGGLSNTELSLSKKAGFIGVRLGPRVLRTETAGLAALAAIQALWGDWK